MVSTNDSSGVCSSTSKGCSNASNTTVSTAAVIPNTANVVPIIRFTVSVSRLPVYCPIKIVLPSVNPVIKLVIICVTCVPVETAATLSALQYVPTTNKSAAPYSDWSKAAAKNGTANRNSVFNIFPSVR